MNNPIPLPIPINIPAAAAFTLSLYGQETQVQPQDTKSGKLCGLHLSKYAQILVAQYCQSHSDYILLLILFQLFAICRIANSNDILDHFIALWFVGIPNV